MLKKCVICRATFKAPPSSKKVTCSPACRSKRAADAARRGHKWSDDARRRRASDPYVIAGLSRVSADGLAAAAALPEGQRGPQNRESKMWELIDPDGNHITVTNLLDWARNNYTLFEPPCDDVDAAARRVSNGIMTIATSMRGARSRQRPVSSYKGWGLARLPEKGGKHD